MKPYEMFAASNTSRAVAGRAGLKTFEVLPGVHDTPTHQHGGAAGPSMAAWSAKGPPKKNGYEILPGRTCGCDGETGCGGGCNGGQGGLKSWTSVWADVINAGWGEGDIPDWIRRDNASSGGSGPASNICRALDGEIQNLRDEIRRRWGGISDDENDRRRIRRAWEEVDRACRFEDQRSPCDIYTELLGNFGDPNRDVALYNALNVVALRCGREDYRRAEATGLGRVLRCIIATNIARSIEQDVARRRGATPPYRYEYDIAPLERRLAGMENLVRTQCGPPRVDATPDPSSTLDRDPSSGGVFDGGFVGVRGSCTLIGSGGCNRSSRTGRCSYGGDCGRQCDRTVGCGPDTNWEVYCPATDPC